MPVEINILETERFGITAARLSDAAATPVAIEAAARALGVRLLTCRVAADDLPRVHSLEAAGYLLMDTLVYHERILTGLPAAEPLQGIGFRLAMARDAQAVRDVARAGFAGYLGHYHADPLLEKAAADEVYVDWAGRSVRNTSATDPVLLAEIEGRVVGFLTLRNLGVLYPGSDEVEAVLSAIYPDHQGRGIYAAFLVRAMGLAAAMGAARLVLSTQIQNYAVQRVWARLGFTHVRSLYTFHKWF
jgi:ribosomal protein S18 acetylase RimI-like enzyme